MVEILNKGMKVVDLPLVSELYALVEKKKEWSEADRHERMANEAARFIHERYALKKAEIVIFAGTTDMGAVGIALARILSADPSLRITLYLLNIGHSQTKGISTQVALLNDSGADVDYIEVTQQMEAPHIASDTIVIDALFGSQAAATDSAGYWALIRFINSVGAETISLDLPSGLAGDITHDPSTKSVLCAKYTLTYMVYKLPLLLADSEQHTGEVYLLDCGVSDEDLIEVETPYVLTDKEFVSSLLHIRPKYAHKGSVGHAMLIAGKWGMAGASILSARASLRSGVGKLSLHIPQRNNDILQVAVPEAILEHDENDCIFSVPSLLSDVTAVGIGPGIGTDKCTALALMEQLSQTAVPMVLDADAINILSEHKGWLAQVPHETILTPHHGEMRRLIGNGSLPVSALLKETVRLASRHHLYILLKGHYSAICCPDGRVFFNPTGNPGMATAGAGDVLTGIILSFLAQGYTALDACILAAYLHGLAGDMIRQDLGEESLVASDLVDYLPKAFQAIRCAD